MSNVKIYAEGGLGVLAPAVYLPHQCFKFSGGEVQQTWEQERQGELQVVFENGVLTRYQSLADIRRTLNPGAWQ